MKKLTIYDSSLVDGIRQRLAMYNAYAAPKVDLDRYLFEMENPAGLVYKPDGYNALDYFSDAFAKWLESRNLVERDKALGDYIMEEEEYNKLKSAEQFLMDWNEFQEIQNIIGNEPNIAKEDPERFQYLKGELNRLSTGIENNSELYKEYVDKNSFGLYKDIEQAVNSNGLAKKLDRQIAEKELELQKYISKADENQKDVDYWSKRVSSYYNKKEQSTPFSFTDVDSYLYKVPGLMGSSAANYAWQAISMGSAVIASVASGGLAVPFAGLAVTGTINSRDNESKAEVFSNYREKVLHQLDPKVKNRVLTDTRKRMEESGKYTESEIKDDNYVLDQLLTGVITSDNAKFNHTRLKAKDGILSLYSDNMALSVMDVTELALQVTPIGKIAKAAKAIPGIGKAVEGASKAASYTGALRELLSKRIDDVITYGLRGIDNLPRRRTVQRLVDLGGRIGITAAMEGAEEGIQYIKGLKFINDEFEKDPNLLKSFVNNIGTGARSIYAAITPWDPVYSDDKEFLENFKGGALLGGLMTGGMGGLQTAVSMPGQISADKFVAKLYADKLDAKDRVRKNELYGQRMQAGKWDKVEEAFDYLLSQEGIEEEAKAEIREEQKRAGIFKNTYTAPSTLAQAVKLGIDPRTSDYTTFVALKEHQEQLVVDTYKNRVTAERKLGKLLNGELVTNHINSIAPDASAEDLVALRDLIRNKAALDKIKELNERYEKDADLLNELQNRLGTRTSKSDVVKFHSMLNKDVKGITEKFNTLLEAIKANIPAITEDQLVVPTSHEAISNAMETVIAADMDNARAQEEVKIMRSTNKKAIKAKMDKWNDVEGKEIDYVLELEDFYNGKDVEEAIDNVKEVEPVTLDTTLEDTAEENKPEVQQEPESLVEPESKEDEYDNEAAAKDINQRREKYVDFSKDIKGEVRNSTAAGNMYYKLNNILKNMFSKVYPTKKYTYASEQLMNKEGDLYSDYYQDIAQIRDLLSDALYEVDEERIQVLTQKAQDIINGHVDHEGAIEFITEARNKFIENMLAKNAERFAAVVKSIEELETPAQTADPVQPSVEELQDKPAQAEDQEDVEEEAPTLGDILGPLLGAPASQPIGTVAQPQVALPQVQQQEAPKPAAPTYNTEQDTYSHRLVYWLKVKERDEQGRYIHVPKKYRGNDYLNNEEFALATLNRDFLEESTVEFEVSTFTDDKGNTIQDIFAVFTYKGQKYASYIPTLNYLSQDKHFQTLPYDQLKDIRNNLDTLRNKVLELNKLKKQNPNLKIVPTKINVTNGKVLNEKNEDGSPKNKSLLDSAWLTEKDPYAINPNNTRIGISTGPISNATVRYQDQIVSLKGGRMGSMLMLVEVLKLDGTTDTAQIQLNPLKLKGNDAAADLILKLVTANQRDYVDANGVQTPITNIEMLLFLVNYGTHTATNPNDTRLNDKQRQLRLSKQFYTDENGNVILGSTVYSLNDLLTNPTVQQQFKDYIKDNFHFAIDENGVNRNYFGGDSQSTVRLKGFEAITAWMQNTGNTKITVIPGQIEFTAKDFGLRKYAGKIVPLNNLPNGISVLGWYIKNGWIQTDAADRFYDVAMWVDDVTTEDQQQKQTREKAQEKVIEQSKDVPEDVRNLVFDLPSENGGRHTVSMKDIFDILDGKDRKDGPAFEANEPTSPINLINISDAKKWLQDKLGLTDEQIEVVQASIEVTASGAKVMGRVRQDSIVLSEQAPEGVQYHEAWHRVSQLLISEKKRRAIYDKYNKRHKTNLTDSQIDEILAEDYRSFMVNADQSTYTKGFNLFNWFKQIADFVKIWARTGQYTLAQLYTGISRGRFSGIQPGSENIERFKRIYSGKGPNFEIGGVKFDNITSLSQFDNIVKSLTYAFFLTNFTKDVIDYLDIAKMGKNFELLRRTLVNTANSTVSPVMDEIVEKYDTVFMPAVAKRLKSLGIRAIEKKQEEEMNAVDAGETEGVNIGQHTIEGMNISIKDNAPAEVKLFFQTIPQYKLNKEGKPEAYIDPNTGFPHFIDEKAVWINVLKDLAGARNLTNIVTIVALKALTSPFYMALLSKLLNYILLSKNSDPKVAINAEALLSKLETVVTSDINTFITIRVANDENGFTNLKMIDNTVDMKAATYPKVWSQSLFYNAGIFKYNEAGVIVAQEGAKKTLEALTGHMKEVITAFVNNKGMLKVKTANGAKTVDLHQSANQEMFKQYLSALLNRAGIGIDKATINVMLQSGDYGDPKADQYTLLNKFVTSGANYGGFSRIVEVLNTINKAIDGKGNISEINISGAPLSPTSIYNNIGFVKALANAFAYAHSTDNSLSSLGPDGASYYMVSLNNFAKDRVSELNENPKLVEQLKSVVWNNTSLLLLAAGKTPLNVETFINFKDVTSHDTGRDYFGITDREDYIAKMTAVFNDRIIFPTVADKKTYHFIRGVKLPHERLQLTKVGKGTLVTFGDQSLNILAAYAQDELNTIELTLRLIDDDPSHFRNGIHYNEDGTVNKDWLDPKRRIKNYHTPNKYKDSKGKTHKIEGNGARFRFLTGVYVDGKYISFNDPKKSAKLNLDTARRYFFDLPESGKKRVLSDILTHRLKGEIKTATKLGIIKNAAPNRAIWGLRNELLDDLEVQNRQKAYYQHDQTNAESYAILDMLSDYMINSIISIMEVEKVFSGDPAYYKFAYDENGLLDISIDKIKRLGALTSTGTNNRLDFFNDPIRLDYVVAELQDYEIASKQYAEYERLFTIGSIKETIQQIHGVEAWQAVKDLSIKQIEESYPQEVEMASMSAKLEVAGYKEGINVADAAVYISPNMFRDLMRMQGKWSPAIKRAFEILTNPETADKWESDPKLYKEANKTILNALKYMAMGTRFSVPGLAVPYFNKMALFPLFKSIATGDLSALYDRMTGDNPIDMVMFNSAVKAGSESPTAPYTGVHESEIELKDGQTVLSAELMEQAENEHLTNFDNLHTYTQPFKYLRQQLATNPHTHEEQMLGTQFIKVGLSNLIDSDIYGKDKLTGRQIKSIVMDSLKRLSDMGRASLEAELLNEDGSVNVPALVEMLKQDAEDSDANDNIITALVTENGELRMPLDAISDNSWIESRFISLVNKRTIDVNIPGGAFIQRSPFGLEASSSRVITQNMLNYGRPLKSINEEGSMDSIVSINMFKHIIPNYNNMTFKEARQWLIDRNIIGDKATANAIGYRIPTQSVASISGLRFVDVFPEIMGDTIMLPEDFTKLTGSDFDIDKLYVARYSYDKEGNLITGDESEAGIKNKMLNAYLNVLLTPENSNQLKLSIDNATNNVKDLLNDVVHHVEPFEVYTPTYQEARKAEYTGGKAGIGPFALNNAHHILTQLTGIKMTKNVFTETLGIRDLGKIWDDPTPSNPKGGRVLDWLSAMINAFVDIAKDPYIVRLNVNAWTYNMVSFLLRTGKGRNTFHFISQPILKEIAEAVLKTKGKYGIDRTKSPSMLEREAIESVLDKYDPDKTYRKLYGAINEDEVSAAAEYQSLFREYLNDDNEYTTEARELLRADALTAFEDYNKRLVKMYYAFLALKPYADSLANLVKYSKVDTKKMGKSFAEQLVYRFGMEDMKNDPNFEDTEIERFYNETFIEKKTANSVDFGYSIFSNQLFRNTTVFTKRLGTILSLLGRATTANAKLLNPIIKGMETLMKSEFFNSLGVDISSLLTGERSIAKRLNNFKLRIQRGDYPELLRYDGTIANDFLEYLLPNINAYNGYDFIDTSEIIQGDQAQSDNLINYWRELLEHPDERVRKLAEDLALYAWYTSGDGSAMNSFFKYLPNSYRITSGYNDFVKSKLHDLINNGELGTFDMMEVLANNWHNDAVVRPIEYYKRTEDGGYRMMKHIDMFEDSVAPNIILGEFSGAETPAIKPINWVQVGKRKYPVFPPMVKFRDLGGFTPLNWHLYQLIGYKMITMLNGMKQYTPLYALIDKKGMKYKGHTVVEYGNDTVLTFNLENLAEFDLMDKETILQYADDKVTWKVDLLDIKYISELPSYRGLNYAKGILEMIHETEDSNDEDNATPLEEVETPTQPSELSNQEETQGTEQEDVNPGAAEWSAKEGWSVNYFNNKVLPKLHEAWQMEYELAPDQSVPADFKGQMNYSYGENAASGILSSTTLEAIKNGERTATTRYESDGNLDYWKNVKVGDVIEFYNKQGDSVKVVVTKPLTKLIFKDNKLTRTSDPTQATEPKSTIPVTTNYEAIGIMDAFTLGTKRIKEELAVLEDLTDEEMQTYLREFYDMMREENVKTVEQVEGVVNKFLCNL